MTNKCITQKGVETYIITIAMLLPALLGMNYWAQGDRYLSNRADTKQYDYPSVQISLNSSSTSVTPGGWVSVGGWVDRASYNITHTYSVRIFYTMPEGINIQILPSDTLYIQPNSSKTYFQVRISADDGIRATTTPYQVTLNCTWEDLNDTSYSGSSSAMLFLSVDHIYGVAVEVKGSATKTVAIGTDSKKVAFTLVLRNTGNTPDEFVLDLYNSDINADGWAVSFTPSTVLLGAGEETEVKVTVYTPSDYPSSPYHQDIIITAKSKGAMAKGQDVRESVTLDVKVEQDVVGYYSTMAALVGIIALIITLIAYFLYRRKKRKDFGGEDKGE